MSQGDLDHQASSAILDMFPAIPKRNLNEIVEHAFELVSSSSLNCGMSNIDRVPIVLGYKFQTCLSPEERS